MEIQDKHIVSAKKLLVDTGLLFRINHEILFPLGIALVHVTPEDPEAQDMLVVADVSEDYEEGFVATVKQIREYVEKINASQKEFFKRLTRREDALGYIIQPLPQLKTADVPSMPTFTPPPADFKIATATIKPLQESIPIAEGASESVEARNARVREYAASKHRSNTGNHPRQVLSSKGGGDDQEISPVYTARDVETCPHPTARLETVRAGTGSVTVCLDCGANMEDVKAAE